MQLSGALGCGQWTGALLLPVEAAVSGEPRGRSLGTTGTRSPGVAQPVLALVTSVRPPSDVLENRGSTGYPMFRVVGRRAVERRSQNGPDASSRRRISPARNP